VNYQLTTTTISNSISELNVTDQLPETSQSSKGILSRFTYFVNIFYSIGSTIFENLFQYIAIFLGSAGIIQGLITSVRQLGNALLNPIWGRLSDKFGRKRFLMIGNFFLGINALLIPNSPDLFFLFLFIIFQTILNAMIIPTWSGYLGDVTSKSIAKRGTLIGKLGMITTLSSNFLLVSILFFIDSLDPFRVSLYVLAIPFYIGSLSYFTAFAFAYRLPTLKNRKTPSKAFPKINFKELSFPRPFIRLLILDSLFTIAWSLAWPLFPYVNFDVAQTWFQIGLLAFISAIFSGVGQNFSGKLMDRFGKRKLIIFGRFFIVLPPLFYIMAITTSNINFIFFSNIIVGITLGSTGIAITTLILDSAPEENRSSYQALYLMITGISAFIGSTFMGFLLQIFSGNITPSHDVLILLFLLASIFRLFTWFGFFFLKETEYSENNI
jgi:MFS family permease